MLTVKNSLWLSCRMDLTTGGIEVTIYQYYMWSCQMNIKFQTMTFGTNEM